jgi:hypothetical protein
MKLIQIFKEIKATPPTDWNRIEEIVIDDLEGWVDDIFSTDFDDIQDFNEDDFGYNITPMFAYSPVDKEGIMDVYSLITIEDLTNTYPFFPKEYVIIHSFDPYTYEVIDQEIAGDETLWRAPLDIIYLKNLD